MVTADAERVRGSGPALAAALVVSCVVAQLWLTHDLAQLPAPLFGGDYFYQAGCIESIRASGNPMASCSVCGALPGYLPAYGALVAGFSWATRLPVVPSMLLMSAVLRGLSVLVVVLVLADLFGWSTGLALGSLWVMLNPGLIVKYTDFTAAIVVPLYFHALFRVAGRPRLAHALYLGLVLALAGYSHAVVFMGGTAIAAGTSVLAALWRGRAGGTGRELFAGARAMLIVVACETLALGYWYRPLWVFHGHTSAHYVEWNGGEALSTLGQRMTYARELLASLVRFDNVPRAELNLLFPLGLLCAWRTRERGRFVPGLILAGVTMAWAFHYFVSMPMLKVHFVPAYVWRLLWGFAILFVAAIPVVLLFERMRGRVTRLALEAALVALGLGVLAGETAALARSADMVPARRPLSPDYAELQAVVKHYTRPEDVFLSTNELSFACSALTGRKVLVTRRAQNDAFVDMDERNRDAALILYGHDDTLRRRLLAHWNIQYLLWTEDWEDGEFQRGENGQVYYSDPLMFFYNPEYEAALRRAGVATVTDSLWVDPALRGPQYPRFDLTVVTPDNYERPGHPWRPALDSLLQEVWFSAAAGHKTAAVYRIIPR